MNIDFIRGKLREGKLENLSIFLAGATKSDKEKIEKIMDKYFLSGFGCSKKISKIKDIEAMSYPRIEINYSRIPCFFLRGLHRGAMETSDYADKVIIRTELPRNKSFNVLRDIKEELQPKLDDDAQRIYEDLNRYMVHFF